MCVCGGLFARERTLPTGSVTTSETPTIMGTTPSSPQPTAISQPPFGQSAKACPRCRAIAPVDARQCGHCGNVYETQFIPQPAQIPQLPVLPSAYPQPYSSDQPPPYLTQTYIHPGPQHGPPAYPPAHYHPTQMAAYPQPGIIQKYPGTHSPVAAVLLGILLTGGGQMFNGQVVKGLVWLLGSFVLCLCTCGLSTFLTWPLAAIEAGIVAGRLNRGEAVRTWQSF